MLQRTRAETVALFFPLFIRRYPSWRRLACASKAELGRVMRPIGLWRQRSARLFALAREMARRRGRFPGTREEIEAIPMVGQYIASAVLLFCHGQPEPLLDVNMARVLERYFGPRRLADIRYDPYLQSLARKVVACRKPAQINWAILDLAALICKPRSPLCVACPAKKRCRYHRLSRRERLTTVAVIARRSRDTS